MNDAATYSMTETFHPRRELLLASWLTRDLPLRDYLLGDVVCSTSRWLIFGDTGIGKTLFALSMAGAMASGGSFLGWEGKRRARVMYLDGEMPAETFKERMQLVADECGENISLCGYNREVLKPDESPSPASVQARSGSTVERVTPAAWATAIASATAASATVFKSGSS